MRSLVLSGLVCAPLLCGTTAVAAPEFYSSLGGDSVLQPRDDTKIQARFRVDVTNWDTRLEFDGDPNNGDVTGNVSNNLNFYETTLFGFELAYDSGNDEATWTISGPSGILDSLTQPTTDLSFLNTIQVATSGSRGDVTVTNLAFTGLGMDVNSWPDVDTNPGGPTFAETFLFFGDGFNLLGGGDWTVTGNVDFASFTRNNPSEGTKVTVELRNAEIPAPGATAIIALGAIGLCRRRR